MTAMPAHVVAHLIAIGRLDSDGISRSAHASKCHCGAVVFVGLDDDKCAVTARVDPLPLSPAGEVEALLTNRRTFDLGHSSRGYRIDPRFVEHIRKPGTADVVAEHRCGARPLSDTESRLKAAQRLIENRETPF